MIIKKEIKNRNKKVKNDYDGKKKCRIKNKMSSKVLDVQF